MQAVAVDLQRSNRSNVAVKLPGQSNTAQDTFAVQGGDSPTTVLAKLIGTSAAAGGSVGMATGSLSGIVVGAGTMFAGAMREAGLRRVDELVRDTLLDPRKAKILLETMKPDERAKELGLARRFRATLPAVAGIAIAGERERQMPRGPIELPAFLRDARAAPPQPITSGNPLIDAVAAQANTPPPPRRDP